MGVHDERPDMYKVANNKTKDQISKGYQNFCGGLADKTIKGDEIFPGGRNFKQVRL